MLASTLSSVAAAAAPRVVVIDSADSPASVDVARRVRDELRTEGFDVSGSEEPDDDPPVATIRLQSDAEVVGVRVELARSSTGEREMRSFHGEAAEGRTLSLRIVEFILASRIELERSPEVRAKPAASTQPPSTQVRRAVPSRQPHRLKFELEALLWAGTLGRRPAVGPLLGVAYGLVEGRLWLELRLSSFGKSTVDDELGAAELQHSLALVGARYDLAIGERLGFFVAASSGAYLLEAAGSSRSELQPSDEFAAVLAGTLGGGAFARLTKSGNLTAVARVESLFTALRPTIRFADATMDRMAHPTLLASIGAEVYF